MDTQNKRLLNGEAEQLRSEVKQAKPLSKQARKAKAGVVRYYENNISRRQYHLYWQAGYRIGSGAIQAAHRNVVQQRLKLSAQRWSREGAQQIVSLRACKKSSQWNTVVQLIKIAA
jgi:hypothetical protein